MKKIFETSQIKSLDQYTIENEPIDSIDLVERAATFFVNEFCKRFPLHRERIYVFAGQGNNGADALAIARLLTEKGYNVFTYLINPSNTLTPDCATNKRRLQEAENRQFVEIAKGVPFAPPVLTRQDTVIDGLFGSGLNRPLEGGFAKIVEYINASGSTVISIDIPSGLFGEDNRENNSQSIIQAHLTLTFEFPKLSFLLPENADFVGEWKVLSIGLHPDALKNTKSNYYLISEEDIALRPRYRFSHKGDYGHALLIAGGLGKMGAAVLAAKGCMRSGVGLLTVHTPYRAEMTLQVFLPEAMLNLDTNKDYITEIPDIAKYAAIGIGPGIGTDTRTVSAFERLLEIIDNKPLVVDADALNIISQKTELLKMLPEGTILTPHPKEFDRIAGQSENEYERIQKARSIANEQKIAIILKGAYTAVCLPSGKVFFNTSGNPGMATAGSGDVLTGILLGLLAQGYGFEAATVIGVYIHGFAGDLAAKRFSQESMLAGDITAMLGKAFLQLKEE